MQPPILTLTTSSNSNRPTSILPFLDVTKPLIGVCFSSSLTVFTFIKLNYIATGSPTPGSFSVLCVALSFAFSATVCEVLIRKRFPAAAGAMEGVALVSIVTAFFMLMFFLLPEDLRWFLLIPFLLVLVPFLHPILRGIIIMYHAFSTRNSVVATERMTTEEESTLPWEAVVAETGSSTGHSVVPAEHNTRMTPMKRARSHGRTLLLRGTESLRRSHSAYPSRRASTMELVSSAPVPLGNEDDADYEANVVEEGQQKGGEDWNVDDVLDY